MANLRFDAQGKAVAQMLLDMPLQSLAVAPHKEDQT